MSSRFQPPPIIKAIERLLVDIEQAYVIFPTHMYVRRRVVRHAIAAVALAAGSKTKAGRDRLRAVLASYLGHFAHANATRLSARLEHLSHRST